MTLTRSTKHPISAVLVILAVLLCGQLWALPAAFGQADAQLMQGLDIEVDLLAVPWADPMVTFGLEDLPPAPAPNYDFAELSASSVFESGVENLAVSNEPNIGEERTRHLRALQAVATAELALATVDEAITSAENSITSATQSIATTRRSIVEVEADINRMEVEIANLETEDRSEADEQSRLISEIDLRNDVIVEMAIQAFTGEDLALETIIADPESTVILEQRVVIDEVRGSQRSEISEFEGEFDESAQRREQLAAEIAPRVAMTVGWEADIVAMDGEIEAHIEERTRLRGTVVELQERGFELAETIEATLHFAEATAAQYQVAYHRRLDAFVSGTDIPLVALNAYVRASRMLGLEDPGCGIHWSQLAGIGRIESFHGYFGNSTLDVEGHTTQNIIGLALDGRVLSGGTSSDDLPEATGRTEENSGVVRLALIRDSDGGSLDGDRTYDRAVGPMQFIPSTWRLYGADGDGDGQEDPQNIYDASLAAARYLCAAPGSMLTSTGEQRAYFAYNHDLTYSANVTRAGRGYHNSLNVSPESSAFASFARLPVPERAPVVESETPDDETTTDEPPEVDVLGLVEESSTEESPAEGASDEQEVLDETPLDEASPDETEAEANPEPPESAEG